MVLITQLPSLPHPVTDLATCLLAFSLLLQDDAAEAPESKLCASQRSYWQNRHV